VAGLFIVAMVVTGSLPESRQLVKFEAKGVMRLAPANITTVEIQFGGTRHTLRRAGTQPWSLETGAVLDATAAAEVGMAVQFMNSSSPTREMRPEELSGIELREFGLDRPRVSVTLYEGPTRILVAHFGAHNPDGLLQYMSVDGERGIFLMSRFVGEQWEWVANRLSTHD
jgi:hypothetical protein